MAEPTETDVDNQESIGNPVDRVTDAITSFVQNSLSVNADRINHLSDLNKAAYKKYSTIAEATKAFQEKMGPVNEQCTALSKGLEQLDSLVEEIDKMEKQVAELDAFVTNLEKISCAQKKPD